MRRKTMFGLGIAAAIVLAWWMFRSTRTTTGRSTVTARRVFGRVTRLDLDRDGNGRAEEQWLYSWRHPAVHHELPYRIRLDQDQDGRWDTWITPENQHDLGTFAMYSADLNSDGKPDWSFRAQMASEQGIRTIEKRRGF
jgi:hypothetical protein